MDYKRSNTKLMTKIITYNDQTTHTDSKYVSTSGHPQAVEFVNLLVNVQIRGLLMRSRSQEEAEF